MCTAKTLTFSIVIALLVGLTSGLLLAHATEKPCPTIDKQAFRKAIVETLAMHDIAISNAKREMATLRDGTAKYPAETVRYICSQMDHAGFHDTMWLPLIGSSPEEFSKFVPSSEKQTP